MPKTPFSLPSTVGCAELNSLINGILHHGMIFYLFHFHQLFDCLTNQEALISLIRRLLLKDFDSVINEFSDLSVIGVFIEIQ